MHMVCALVCFSRVSVLASLSMQTFHGHQINLRIADITAPKPSTPKPCTYSMALQWRHKECDGVSYHQLTIVYSTVYSGADQRKHLISSASLAFARGIHRRPVNSPHKGPVYIMRKMVPFDDVIMECMLLIPLPCTCNVHPLRILPQTGSCWRVGWYCRRQRHQRLLMPSQWTSPSRLRSEWKHRKRNSIYTNLRILGNMKIYCMYFCHFFTEK